MPFLLHCHLCHLLHCHCCCCSCCTNPLLGKLCHSDAHQAVMRTVVCCHNLLSDLLSCLQAPRAWMTLSAVSELQGVTDISATASRSRQLPVWLPSVFLVDAVIALAWWTGLCSCLCCSYLHQSNMQACQQCCSMLINTGAVIVTALINSDVQFYTACS